MKTGIGVRDAFKALKALDLDPVALAKIQSTVNVYEDVLTACKVNSFTGDTKVLMTDGSRKPIRDVRIGDMVLATDPASGRSAQAGHRHVPPRHPPACGHHGGGRGADQHSRPPVPL